MPVLNDGLKIGGMTPLSTIDFPGRLATVLYTQGCPLRCRYCHNPELQAYGEATLIPWQKVFQWLLRRRGLLDGVVFSGGEPVTQPRLGEALAAIRQIGFETAIHTAGASPDHLVELLPLLNWIGMDIKAPFDRYAVVTGVVHSGEKARASVAAILAHGVEHEFRTTVHPGLLSTEDLLSIARTLRSLGINRWVLQEFRSHGCTDRELLDQPSRPVTPEVLAALRQFVPDITLR